MFAAASFNGKATTATYLVLFKAINDWMRLNLGREWKPKRVLSDYEAALRAAVVRHFGGGFRVPLL